MKYFTDTKFLEGTQKEKFPISLFRKKTPPTIDLISIGIVAEDGREFYAISNEFNIDEAWNKFEIKTSETTLNDRKFYWIRHNVLKSIWKELYKKDFSIISQIEIMNGVHDKKFTYSNLKILINKYGKTNKQIAEEIEKFCCNEFVKNKIEFYGYFADYDWVVFCWLFEKMIDLPKEFPKYCNDLKQILDEKAKSIPYGYEIEIGIKTLKLDKNFPIQIKQHNALDDARWNKKLYEFLNTIK